jgi:RimJ/RimL family protein N-acetyltransferase
MKFKKTKNMSVFKSLNGKVITGKNIRLREKKLEDARKDYAWQCDPELSRFDAVPVLDMPFALYLLEYTSEIKKPRRTRFALAIENLEGKHIGNCTCYEIEEKKSEAQFGIMIGDADYRDKGYGLDVINTMIDYIFRTTALNRIYLKTLDWNKRAQKCFTRCGFIPYGQMRRNGYNFILMEMFREQWAKRQGSEIH